jgi:hypothetical protein
MIFTGKTFIPGESTYTQGTLISYTITTDARYEKLRKEFLKWCTGHHVRKHIPDKTYVVCFGCQNKGKKFDDIQHDEDCAVAIALGIK